MDALGGKLATTLEGLGGARAVYGDPIPFGDEQIVPVARIEVALSAGADGSGGGNAGVAGLAQRAKGSGGGSAEAAVAVRIEPIGFLRLGPDGPVFVALGD